MSGVVREGVGRCSGWLLGRATMPGSVSALPRPTYHRREPLTLDHSVVKAGCLQPRCHMARLTCGNGGEDGFLVVPPRNDRTRSGHSSFRVGKTPAGPSLQHRRGVHHEMFMSSRPERSAVEEPALSNRRVPAGLCPTTRLMSSTKIFCHSEEARRGICLPSSL